MTHHPVSVEAAGRRESARRGDGKFGHQHRAEADVPLSGAVDLDREPFNMDPQARMERLTEIADRYNEIEGRLASERERYDRMPTRTQEDYAAWYAQREKIDRAESDRSAARADVLTELGVAAASLREEDPEQAHQRISEALGPSLTDSMAPNPAYVEHHGARARQVLDAFDAAGVGHDCTPSTRADFAREFSVGTRVQILNKASGWSEPRTVRTQNSGLMVTAGAEGDKSVLYHYAGQSFQVDSEGNHLVSQGRGITPNVVYRIAQEG